MPHEPLACDHELLRKSLDDRLAEQQEEQLARHLAECPGCRQELERMAGGHDEWSKVRDALTREADSAQSSAPCKHDRCRQDWNSDPDDPLDLAAGFGGPAGEFMASAADFVVDFLEPAATTEAVGRLGDIEILETIGQGGMGVVLKGFQPELKRLVAVKVLGPHLANSGSARKRFAREAQATAAILHPNVMPILMVNSSGKLPFLVMPYFACDSLEQRIAREGPLELVDILRIGTQTAGGLAAAHAQGLVHRDVKPANILLEKGVDRVLLTDFGLARAVDDASITRTGIIAGTPQFMSPEQARGEPVDARSDLFSLGSVLYTLCTGRPPFRAESTFGILRRITDTDPRPIREINSEIPLWLTVIIDKLLAKEPGDRFASAEEVALLLQQCLAHVQQPTTVPLPLSAGLLAAARRPAPRGTYHRRWVWIVVASLVITGLSLTMEFYPWRATKTDAPTGVSAGTASSTSAEPRSTVALAADPSIDWHFVMDQLQEVIRDGEPFEERVEQWWNAASAESSDAAILPRPQVSDQEFKP